MAQTKILLDSNSYFRLAKSVHPLLFETFGDENYCLYVLPELEREYEREPRLKSKFPWVEEGEFCDNRKKRLVLSKGQKRDRKTTYGFLWDYVQTTLPGPSRVDCVVLSYGYVLDIEVVTDDADMIELAAIFGIKTITTLELLNRMLDCGHIDMTKVRSVASYWSYIDDRPKNYARDFRRLFREEAPP